MAAALNLSHFKLTTLRMPVHFLAIFLNFCTSFFGPVADVRVGGDSMPSGTLSYDFIRSVSFNLRAEADQIGQEGMETFDIPLMIIPPLATVTVFVAAPASITVVDQSGEHTRRTNNMSLNTLSL